MKLFVLTLLTVFIGLNTQAQTDVQKLSIDFFNAVKNKSAQADELYKQLGELSVDEIADQLTDDDKILAFWINIYNTGIQYTLGKDPSLFEDRGAFFKAKQMKIAGIDMSFDIIEHGILRRSKNKLSGGYLGKLRVPKYEKKLRIRKVDPRIHYALNCGAKSCPPIFAYHADQVNEELDKSAKTYLEKHVIVDDACIKAPVLFSWFRGDFGGKKGIYKFMLKYGVVDKADRKKEIKFLDYDWTLALDPYAPDLN